MSYMYEIDEQGNYQVGFYMGASKCVDATYSTADEAAARVSYLNGGIHPDLTAMVLKLLPDLFRETLIDPRAELGARCVHGKRSDEPCEQCDNPDAVPDKFRQGAGPI